MGLFTKRADKPPADPAGLEQWMAREYAKGNYAAIWQHRLSLGLGYERADTPDRTWFWLNAYPALSALRTDGKGHPLVSTCAGYADQVHRQLGPDERAANDEIARMFFG